MLRDRSSRAKEADRASEERLLAQEGVVWTLDEEINSCGSFTKTFLRFFAISIFFMSGALFGFFWRGDLDGLCSRHISQQSPIFKDLGIEYSDQKFNGSLLKKNVFRLDAGPEVDAAWDSLGVNYRDIRVKPDEAQDSGIRQDQVKINPKYGGGFPAQVEGLHHLRCLNLLRQSLYHNYGYYWSEGEGVFGNDDTILKHQVSQCLDVLRQQLMCTVDTGVLGQVWINPDSPEPYVDFNTQHRCKNFEKIRHWAEINQLPIIQPIDFLSPPQQGDKIYEEMP